MNEFFIPFLAKIAAILNESESSEPDEDWIDAQSGVLVELLRGNGFVPNPAGLGFIEKLEVGCLEIEIDGYIVSADVRISVSKSEDDDGEPVEILPAQ